MPKYYVLHEDYIDSDQSFSALKDAVKQAKDDLISEVQGDSGYYVVQVLKHVYIWPPPKPEPKVEDIP